MTPFPVSRPLRRSYNNGNAKAGVVLCGTYLEGTFIRRDPRKAFEYILPASDSGVPSAQYILANLLIEGEATPVDEVRAIALLREAARAGYALAIEMLAANEIPLD